MFKPKLKKQGAGSKVEGGEGKVEGKASVGKNSAGEAK